MSARSSRRSVLLPSSSSVDNDDDDGDTVRTSSSSTFIRRSRNTPSISRDPNDPSAWPDEITLDYFYKPHTITILLLSVSGLVFTAFYRDSSVDVANNLLAGVAGASAFFLIISALAFPNGPFQRPHPILWRVVFGLSVLYLLTVQFLIHQDYATVRSIIVWVDPKMENYSIDAEKVSKIKPYSVILHR